eukprot:symbB.v1.2.021103.t1/scaffold1717.1/size104954/6
MPPLVSANWLWAALSDNPKAALADIVNTKSETIHHRAAAALVLGRLEEAVGLYLANELLAEALLLARLRLPSRHPLVLYIYRSWAQDFRRRGRQDQAALCFFATKELGNALSNLEDWLAPSRLVLAPDPLRLSGAFAAAKAAAQLATAKPALWKKSILDQDTVWRVSFAEKEAMAFLTASCLLSLLPLHVAVTITGHIYCDNYFEFYFNGQQIFVDPLDFTPHNAVKVSFEYDESSSEKVYAILCQDYASSSGYEYTSTNSPQLGDGALLAEFSDGTRTSSNWKSYVVTFGPTDASISNGCSASNLAACSIQDNGVPSNWYATDFDDSAWSYATEYTASQAGWGRRPTYSNGQCGTITSPITKANADPSSIATTQDACLDPRSVLCGGDETCSGSDGRFIWGSDMDRDNKMLFRLNATDANMAADSSSIATSSSMSCYGLLTGALVAAFSHF